jgi:Kef-type K+ transport system membrane component KefB
MTGTDLTTLFIVVAIAATVPLLTRAIPGGRIPAVVLLLVGGMVVGPYGLEWANPSEVRLFAELGLGFLFLLAGYEVDLAWFRQRTGRLAVGAWVISAGLAVVVTGVLVIEGAVSAYVPVALALTTTALGTLLPILREHGMLRGSFREHMLATGAVGELLPVVGIAVLLSSNGSFAGLAALVVVAGAAFILARIAVAIRGSRLEELAAAGAHATSQSTLRLSVLLLVGLLLLATDVGIDVVLGAFVAGMVLRQWGPQTRDPLEDKLEAVGYGVFIPIFFVASGMAVDVQAIIESPGRTILFLILLLVVRGMPILVTHRRDLDLSSRVQLGFLAATTLPLLVALVEIGLRNGVMQPQNASALIGAGVLSVVLFPLAATLVHDRSRASMPVDAMMR